MGESVTEPSRERAFTLLANQELVVVDKDNFPLPQATDSSNHLVHQRRRKEPTGRHGGTGGGRRNRSTDDRGRGRELPESTISKCVKQETRENKRTDWQAWCSPAQRVHFHLPESSPSSRGADRARHDERKSS
ncbi:uncharacterized protein CDV56_100557, partial [Aspergillus thermomutatus]